MKIVYLAAGAAGMYCGSCLHDNTLAAALHKLGEDVLLVPTYTPLRTDEPSVSEGRIFFGGINVYLQQKSWLFRHTPWFLDHLLDNRALINLATSFGPGVEAERLGDLTVSMLHGKHGRQSKELKKLVAWLGGDVRPDVVHLSNAMLLGMAGEIHKLGIPVVCSLSGEDVFLDKLSEPFRTQAFDAMRERAGEVDKFVALNQYYAQHMGRRLNLPDGRLAVIPHGLNLEGFPDSSDRDRLAGADSNFTIGYFARICPDKGLHNLIAAVELLNADASLPAFRVRAAGYLGEQDRPYLQAIEKRVSTWKDPGRFVYEGELSRVEKVAFLSSLDCMCLPTVYHESKGLSVLEAMACGVPMVLPAHGAFPEMIADTGGGLLCQPDDPPALAAALGQLIRDRPLAQSLGQKGWQAVRERYQSATMAGQTLELYRQVHATMQASAN